MRVSAASSDCSVDESRPCILSGSVHITQGTLDIQSAKADIRRGDNQQVIKLTGPPVEMKQQLDDGGWMNATAARIDYDQNRDSVIFSGDAVVKQPRPGSISGASFPSNMSPCQLQRRRMDGQRGGKERGRKW